MKVYVVVGWKYIPPEIGQRPMAQDARVLGVYTTWEKAKVRAVRERQDPAWLHVAALEFPLKGIRKRKG